MNVGKGNTAVQEKRAIFVQKETFWNSWMQFQRTVLHLQMTLILQEYFRKLLRDQTNLYSVQKSESHRNVYTIVKELEKLKGLYLCMGLFQMLGNHAYWENGILWCSTAADNVMQPFSNTAGISTFQWQQWHAKQASSGCVFEDLNKAVCEVQPLRIENLGQLLLLRNSLRHCGLWRWHWKKYLSWHQRWHCGRAMWSFFIKPKLQGICGQFNFLQNN